MRKILPLALFSAFLATGFCEEKKQYLDFQTVTTDVTFFPQINFSAAENSIFYFWRDFSKEYFSFDLAKSAAVRKDTPCKGGNFTKFLSSPDPVIRTIAVSDNNNLYICFPDKNDLVKVASGKLFFYAWKNDDQLIYSSFVNDAWRLFSFDLKKMENLELKDDFLGYTGTVVGFSKEQNRLFLNSSFGGDEQGFEFYSVEIEGSKLRYFESIINTKNDSLYSEGVYSVTSDGKYAVFSGMENEEDRRYEIYFVDIMSRRYKRNDSGKWSYNPVYISTDSSFLVALGSSEKGKVAVRYSLVSLKEIFAAQEINKGNE